MTDDQPDDPQREVQRLTAELARRERENTDLKQELVRTKEVQDDLWSHDIYLKARRKMLGGVLFVLGLLSAVGLVTVYELYEEGQKYFNDKMLDTIKDRVQDEASTIVQVETDRISKEADKKMNELINELLADKEKEINSLFEKTERDFATALSGQAEQADRKINFLIADAKTGVDKEIAAFKGALKMERIALSLQIQENQIGLAAPTKAERATNGTPKSSLDCDPNDLDDAQIDLVSVRQLSKGTGRIVDNIWEVFENTLFLHVRESDDSTDSVAAASCFLDGVDRVVYLADPNWYNPSKFVRNDRKDKFGFTISGWGPTELTAQIYFIGRRDPKPIKGHLARRDVTRAEKLYLDDEPIDNQFDVFSVPTP